MRQSDARIIERLCEVLPPIMDEWYKPDRCIAATKHGIAVLAYFGIDAKPVKTQAIAGNRAWCDWIATDPTATSEMPDAAWSVGIDLDPEGERRGYPGHLCLLVAPGLLVDLSLGQMARPQHGILLPAAAAVEIEPGTDKAAAIFNDEEAFGAVFYRLLLPERDWQNTSGWKRRPELAGRMIREIRESLRNRPSEIFNETGATTCR